MVAGGYGWKRVWLKECLVGRVSDWRRRLWSEEGRRRVWSEKDMFGGEYGRMWVWLKEDMLGRGCACLECSA
jgi:hypothetical protein